MRILVTAADTLLGAALCEQLAGTYQVEAAGWAEPFAEDATTARLTRAAEAVVHLAPIYAGDRDTADGLVDYATRRSYNLLQAFAATGNDVMTELVDKHNIGVQSGPDKFVDRGCVFRHQRTQLFDVGTGFCSVQGASVVRR